MQARLLIASDPITQTSRNGAERNKLVEKAHSLGLYQVVENEEIFPYERPIRLVSRRRGQVDRHVVQRSARGMLRGLSERKSHATRPCTRVVASEMQWFRICGFSSLLSIPRPPHFSRNFWR
jgi:hypothetical protein